MRRNLADRISIAELADMQGVHPDTARARLKELERKTGVEIILRSGRRMFTTLTLIRRADPRWMEEREIAEAEIETLQSKVADLDRENLKLRGRIRALENVVRSNMRSA